MLIGAAFSLIGVDRNKKIYPEVTRLCQGLIPFDCPDCSAENTFIQGANPCLLN
jgi:hypothetical protein